MGEIADALRRARETTQLRRTASPLAPADAAPSRGLLGERTLPGMEPLAVAPQPAEREERVLHRIPKLAPTSTGILGEHGPEAEACRRLVVRLLDAMETREAHVLAVTSALLNEGKTTISCNLAIAMAALSRGGPVALVDLDLRRPSLAKVLGVEIHHGIEEVLRGDVALDAACVAVEQPALHLYLARSQRHAHELLASARFEHLLEDLGRRYDLVVLDTPPALVVPDTTIILNHADAFVTVARRGVSRIRAQRQLYQAISKERLIGAILNEGAIDSYLAYAYEEEEEEPETPRSRRRLLRPEVR